MNLRPQFTILFLFLVSGCAMDTESTTQQEDSLAQTESAVCKNALAPSEQKVALELIDDICGDTWCEGDNDFAFEQLTCRGGPPGVERNGSCTLRFRIIPRTESPPSYSRVCTTSGFRGFDSIVETAANGYQSLNWDYYLALTDCIQRAEAALPPQ